MLKRKKTKFRLDIKKPYIQTGFVIQLIFNETPTFVYEIGLIRTENLQVYFPAIDK